MFYIIETQEQLSSFKNKRYENAFVEVISYNDNIHPLLNNVSLIYIKPLNDKGYILCINHNESLSLNINDVISVLKNIKNIYVRNKKETLYYLPIKNLIDISFLHNEIEEQYTQAHNYFYQRYNKENINLIIPLVKHYEKCENIFNSIPKNIFNKDEYPKWFDFYNNKATLCFLEIEKNGIKIDSNTFNNFFETNNPIYSIDNNIIYSQYNLYTTTKRPSNAFNNINFSALNKENGCRKSFIPKNSEFIEIDISAYHPTLIANLINYKFSKDIHTEFSELYKVDYKLAKEITFKQLYGGIFDEYKELEYFKKTQKLIYKLWNDFNSKGYIETPISGYTFNQNEINNPNPNKVFNYFLQELETSNNVNIIYDILKTLRNKKSELVLYVFDSFLIDWDKNEVETLEQIKDIFKKYNLQYKIKYSTTYDFK